MAGISQERKAYVVSIPAHDIEVRPGHTPFSVQPYEATMFESSKWSAIALAVRAAHARSKVPPWRPYLRQTARLASTREVLAVAAAGRA